MPHIRTSISAVCMDTDSFDEGFVKRGGYMVRCNGDVQNNEQDRSNRN